MTELEDPATGTVAREHAQPGAARRPRRRWPLVAITLLGIVVVMAVAGDTLARDYAEKRVQQEVQSSLGLAAPPDVELGGWPFVAKAAQGKVPKLVITADTMTVKQVSVRDVRLELEGVSFDAPALASGEADTVHVESGSGTVSLTGEDFTRAMHRRGYTDHRVDFRGDLIHVVTPQGATSGRADVTVKGRTVTVTPETPAIEPFSFKIPAYAPNTRYTSATIRDSRAVLTFEVHDSDLPL